MEKKLQVKNLTISFRTQNGKVQAVRDISFDLFKGETLAIVGESGSGKSVTSKAIMGISAVNAIIENGEILYDGKDLTKIDESQFYELRGNKLAMIFQDPMSSLNPIMRIGKQLTEAMILKGKANQRDSRNNFNTKLALLKKNIIEAVAEGNAERIQNITEKCANFDKFEYKHLELENAYNVAHEAAAESIDEIEYFLFEIEKKAVNAKTAPQKINLLLSTAKKAVSRYVVYSDAARYNELLALIKAELPVVKKGEFAAVAGYFYEAVDILKTAVAYTMPNFFAMGYYLTFAQKPLPEMSVKELNVYLRKYLDDDFMLDFIADAKCGIMHSFNRSLEDKRVVIGLIDRLLPIFESDSTDKKVLIEKAKELAAQVEKSIDRLAIIKDSTAYTFERAINEALKKYLNNRELAAKKKHLSDEERAVLYGEIEYSRENLLSVIKSVKEKYLFDLENASRVNFDDETVAMIDYLKAQAAAVVHKVTPAMAKSKALKLMEEVGIPEPRKRFKQYPFEFSGGMRQRIVIAIALAANPDVLICDEPTTALDVTIQSQILELINKLKKERNLSVIFITHDLGVVANMADRIAVMYAGKIVEYGTAEDIFYSPAHPYTWALLASMPDLDTKDKLEAIPGTPPNMIFPPKGDAFAERNKYAMEIDFEEQPPMFKISETHSAATWLLHPDAPKVDPPKIVTDRIARMKARSKE